VPIIREVKRPSLSRIQQYKVLGPCLKPGAEIWTVEGKRLFVGTVEKVEKGKGVYIRRADGTVFRTPSRTIMMAEPDELMKAAMRSVEEFDLDIMPGIESWMAEDPKFRQQLADRIYDTYQRHLKRLPKEHTGLIREWKLCTQSDFRKLANVPPGREIAGLYDPFTRTLALLGVEEDTSGFVVFHEVGHAVWHEILTDVDRKKIEKWWKRSKAFSKGEGPSFPYPTFYSLNSPNEYFAECYSMWWSGRTDRVAPEVRSWFDRKFGRYKKAGGRS